MNEPKTLYTVEVDRSPMPEWEHLMQYSTPEQVEAALPAWRKHFPRKRLRVVKRTYEVLQLLEPLK